MPRVPGVRWEEAVRAFLKIGYRVVREGKHTAMSNGVTRLTIPWHNPINSFAMGAIAQDAGLSADQFKNLL